MGYITINLRITWFGALHIWTDIFYVNCFFKYLLTLQIPPCRFKTKWRRITLGGTEIFLLQWYRSVGWQRDSLHM